MGRALPAPLMLPRHQIGRILVAFAWLGLGLVAWSMVAGDSGGDAHAYWAASQADPYGRVVDERDAFVYSPAFLHAMAPLQLLPWEIFRGAWLIAGIGALVWMAGPVVTLLLLIPGPLSPAWTDLWFGNVYALMTAALVVGLRYPAAWAFLALTKLTPGIAFVWFALRREWRRLAIAIGASLAIAAASFLLAPHLWIAWVDTLRASSVESVLVGVPPLTVRLLAATAFLAVGAWRRWPAVLPIAVLLAQPVLWYSAFTLLVAWFPMLRDRARREPARMLQARVHDQPARRVGTIPTGSTR